MQNDKEYIEAIKRFSNENYNNFSDKRKIVLILYLYYILNEFFMKKVIRLTESELHNIITSAAKKIIREASGYIPRDGMTGGAWSYEHDSAQIDIDLSEVYNVTTVDISEEEYDMVAEALGGEPPMVTVNVDYENADDDAVGYFGLHDERVTCDELDELEGVDPSVIEKFKQAIEEFVSNNLESLV